MSKPVPPKTKQNQQRNKAVFFIIVFIVLAGLITSLRQLPFPSDNVRRIILPSDAPQEVRITNVFPEGFTVTWLTKEKNQGAVVFSQKNEETVKQESVSNSWQKVVEQVPGEKGTFVHSVKITNLDPQTMYYFKIISGEKTFFKSISDSWQESGVVAEVYLPAKPDFSSSYFISLHNSPGSFSLEPAAFTACQTQKNKEVASCFRPNPIYGQVVDQNLKPVNQALVFLEIPGKSNTLSTLTNSSGQWVFDLANLLKTDLSGLLGYDPNTDLIKVTATWGVNQSTSSYFSIPSVVNNFKIVNNLIKIKT